MAVAEVAITRLFPGVRRTANKKPAPPAMSRGVPLTQSTTTRIPWPSPRPLVGVPPPCMSSCTPIAAVRPSGAHSVMGTVVATSSTAPPRARKPQWLRRPAHSRASPAALVKAQASPRTPGDAGPLSKGATSKMPAATPIPITVSARWPRPPSACTAASPTMSAQAGPSTNTTGQRVTSASPETTAAPAIQPPRRKPSLDASSPRAKAHSAAPGMSTIRSMLWARQMGVPASRATATGPLQGPPKRAASSPVPSSPKDEKISWA